MLARPPVGSLRLGSLRRTDPISRDYGFDRGQPVDRHYIDRFLARHDRDIRGRVLEIGDDDYTRRFGGWTGAPSSVSRVEAVDVLDAAADNPGATIVADLADAPHVADATYDCVVCTQTLLLIYDVRAAIATTHRILRPGGVVLATVPGTSRICRPEAERFGDWWRFTSMSAGRLFEEAFGPDAVSVSSYGNVLAATAMLHGIAAEELRPEELDAHDPDFEVLIGVRAVRR
jgi:hypothetical protein